MPAARSLQKHSLELNPNSKSYSSFFLSVWSWCLPTCVTNSSSLPEQRLKHQRETISKHSQALFSRLQLQTSLAFLKLPTKVSSWSMLPLTLLQQGNGQCIPLLELCVTPVCTQETCVCVSVCALQGQSLSVNFHFPAFPGTQSRSKPPKPPLCSPVWQGSLLLASQSLRDASSAQKCTWRHIPACALASLLSENRGKNN